MVFDFCRRANYPPVLMIFTKILGLNFLVSKENILNYSNKYKIINHS